MRWDRMFKSKKKRSVINKKDEDELWQVKPI